MGTRSRSVLCVLAAALLFVPGPADAQEAAVTGSVTGADGSPLSNVTIQVVGTELGALTDEDGRFRRGRLWHVRR